VAIEAGQRLLHYRLIEKIGQGGMGVVWKAEDTKLHRHVALKILPERMAADPERRARFEREARAVAALNHPNIVTLHSVEEADTSAGSVHIIAMELVEGKTLAQLLPKNGFSLSRLLEIAIPLADAVSRAHRAGITHRDLKPDNIMFDAEGRLRVLDFGLAKLHDPFGMEGNTQAATVTSDTAEGRVLGTVAYMSPEQAEGKKVDARSDVFSLGTILYEMVTGARPFHGETPMSTIGAILKDEPASITELKQSLPRHAGRIIRRCLAKNPDRRYQTALELRNELEELKREVESGEHAADSRGAETRARWSTRRWVALGVGVVLVVLAPWAIRRWLEQEAPATVYTPVPITSSIGVEYDVNWSPEGEFIAFGRVREGSSDVMVQPVSGGEAEVRAGGPGDQAAPRWSPDGKYLAYVSTAEPGTFVYLIPPHGGTPRKLIETNVSTLDINSVLRSLGEHPWSPDGRFLLVSRVTDSGQQAMYRVDRNNSDAVQVTFPPPASSDLDGSFSYDGKRIVFQRRSHGRGALMMMSATGGDPEVLLADAFDNFIPAFRPDDRRLIFLSDRRGVANLWEIDLEIGSLNQLTFESRMVFDYSVSATNRVAYAPFWHDTFLFVVDVKTGERHQLTSHTMDNFGGSFSPDGRTIAYHSTRSGNSEIFLHHLDGSPETQITDDPGWDMYPDWSPDGRQLIFNSNRQDGRFKIFIANSDGGGERLLLDQEVSISSALYPVNAMLISRWSPDGRRIAYLVTTDGVTSLWTVRPNGEDARDIVRNVGWFDWYRDSRRVVYTRPRGSDTELVAVNLETGEDRSLYVGPLMEVEVSPDGEKVAFCLGPGHMTMGLAVLKLEPPADPGGLPEAIGEPEYVVRTEGTWHVHNGGWAPDSKRLVYTQDQDYGDVYELVAGH
jgi:Tol biopolymer transport system component/tRNA A-37 threonylcarbamoyl transferase component Bud32